MDNLESKNKYAELNNGVKMPLMGYGTFLCEEGQDLHDNIVYAVVECGYRHIDTATLYDNEKVIGDALKTCFEKGIKREDLFIVTKLWRDTMDKVEESIKTSLEKLQLDYVDLYLVHWTCTDVDWDKAEVKGPPLYEVWKDMEALVEKGLTKSIGISNCNAMTFINILAGAKIKPVTNQIENNPYLAQTKLVDFTKKFGCTTTAYAPIGASGFTGNDLLEDETVKSIAKSKKATPAQVCLAWNMARGVIVIPKSMNKERIQENFDSLSLKLSKKEIEKIDSIDKGSRKFNPEGWDAPQFGWKYVPIFY